MRDRTLIYRELRRKMEDAGFQFEKEQQPHRQNRKEKELKFTHPNLLKKFDDEGMNTLAKKFYIKPLSDEVGCEIGLVTGSTSPLYDSGIFAESNAVDTFQQTPAWTNRENDSALDSLLTIIKSYLGKPKANPDWVRDEVILALDVYLTDKSAAGNKTHPLVIELSNILNQLPIFPKKVKGGTFRNPNGVGMKLSNFLRLDPAYSGVGLKRGGKLEEAIWNEFIDDKERLHATANAIKSLHKQVDISEYGLPIDDVFDAPEGRLLTVIHKQRERSRALVNKKKQQVLNKLGKLACEACDFDFSMFYGNVGDGFIECHHDVPVSTLGENSRTSLIDLRLVCSNCHSMIHRTKPRMSVAEL